jgi:Zn-dependent membrane protease YugP
MRKALFLSEENYSGKSLAALGVAAHEAGHALQHKAAYAPLKLRMMLVPATQFASSAYIPIILLGIFVQGLFPLMISLAIGIFSVITLFQLITLPVEFDASKRAKEQLLRIGLVREQEASGVGKVLNAAGMTYVAAMVTSALQLFQFVLLAQGRD